MRLMSRLTVLLLGWFVVAPLSAEPQAASPAGLRAERQAAEARDLARLEALLGDRQALESALEEARAAHAEAEARHRELGEREAVLDERREALAARRSEQDDGLASILASLARHGGELRDALAESWLTTHGAELPPRLDGQEVLTLADLEAFADGLMALTAETGRVVRFMAPVAGVDGEIRERPVVRLGDFAAFTPEALLRLGADDATLAVAEGTPEALADDLAAFHAGASRALAIDPTHGQVLAALAQQPSLWERFRQGGAVGYVVVALGAAGMLVALLQYAYLLRVSLAVRRQRRDLKALRDDNPLGRVLARFRALSGEGHPVPEALEARLDEAVLAELPRLERGQPLVKLLAAVAPLLGLLGTVTGMIVTFQAITVFGTGDPQLMAGGISQALVTTVLGLITAVPLLFAHTALSARSRQLAGVVEGLASAALAEHLEGRGPTASRDEERARRDAALA
ncbi:MotA/TolQ/ExbB proton channel family protein [Halomonas pacifica]|uniref:MotA/TolQ/ExbB proton channel family protein n=1 Tax=Bisbaumannia pacifica TaxID=77098 RepID=UPI002358D613|nr:MotA/TolQ/ExbB proton channel family protein [Halomonas pacifica]MDC8804306.1 MotA/TolQ/ExbB proton channel family protein [Halomonas pacifica]